MMKHLLFTLLLLIINIGISQNTALTNHINRINSDGIKINSELFKDIPMDSILHILNVIERNGNKSLFNYLHPKLKNQLNKESWCRAIKDIEKYYGKASDFHFKKVVVFPTTTPTELKYELYISLGKNKGRFDIGFDLSNQSQIYISYFNVYPVKNVIPILLKDHYNEIISLIDKKNQQNYMILFMKK